MKIIMSESASDEFLLDAWFDEYDEKKKKYKDIDICMWREGQHLILLPNTVNQKLSYRIGSIDYGNHKLSLRQKIIKIIKERKIRKAKVIIIDLKDTYDSGGGIK